jgi:hypothetical protein
MSFCHSPRSYVSEMDSIRSKIIGAKETSRLASRGPKKKKQFEGEVH